MGQRFAFPLNNPGFPTTFAFDGYSVTPADGTDLPVDAKGIADGLYVTGAGNVACYLLGNPGVSVTIPMLAGQVLPIAVTRVLATGTTATGIFALYR